MVATRPTEGLNGAHSKPRYSHKHCRPRRSQHNLRLTGCATVRGFTRQANPEGLGFDSKDHQGSELVPHHFTDRSQETIVSRQTWQQTAPVKLHNLWPAEHVRASQLALQGHEEPQNSLFRHDLWLMTRVDAQSSLLCLLAEGIWCPKVPKAPKAIQSHVWGIGYDLVHGYVRVASSWAHLAPK